MSLTTIKVNGSQKTGRQVSLPDLYAGDTKAHSVTTYHGSGASKDTAKDLAATSTVLIYDPDRQTTGTATAGSTTTLVDATLDQAADFWNGITIRVQIGDNTYTTVVEDFDGAGTLTLGELPEAVDATTDYTLFGYPLLPREAAEVSENEATLTLDPTDTQATERPGNRTVVLQLVFADGDAEALLLTCAVLAPRAT